MRELGAKSPQYSMRVLASTILSIILAYAVALYAGTQVKNSLEHSTVLFKEAGR